MALLDYMLTVLATAGGGPTGVDSELDPQAVAQEMCAARGLADDLDFVGSLAVLAAGSIEADAIASLRTLGATGSEIVGNVNELAGTTGLELGEAMREWASSGNF